MSLWRDERLYLVCVREGKARLTGGGGGVRGRCGQLDKFRVGLDRVSATHLLAANLQTTRLLGVRTLRAAATGIVIPLHETGSVRTAMELVSSETLYRGSTQFPEATAEYQVLRYCVEIFILCFFHFTFIILVPH